MKRINVAAVLLVMAAGCLHATTIRKPAAPSTPAPRKPLRFVYGNEQPTVPAFGSAPQTTKVAPASLVSSAEDLIYAIKDDLMNVADTDDIQLKFNALKQKQPELSSYQLYWEAQYPELIGTARTALRIVDIQLENALRKSNSAPSDLRNKHILANANLEMVRVNLGRVN